MKNLPRRAGEHGVQPRTRRHNLLALEADPGMVHMATRSPCLIGTAQYNAAAAFAAISPAPVRPAA